MSDTPPPTGPLVGLKVLDLSRILAGPTCTQLLGDMGAEIWKIERPGRGDDTRHWGPPFLQDADGNDTQESAYYLSANRSKRSLAIDLATQEGQDVIRRLACHADILVENFKPGDLKRRGLDHDSLSALNPRLIYASITGFGQTGPYAHRPGYDFLIQGMGGIMSLTGKPDQEGGEPTKAGVGIADVMCGMYTASAILAALHHRHATGQGQHIDIALFDTQIAWLINQGVAYLTDGQVPPRRGNAHPTIVPYDAFPASDGHFILAVGNDDQFRRFCQVAGAGGLAEDRAYATNAARVRHRETLGPLVADLTRQHPMAWWLAALEAVSVPCGPINTLDRVFSDPQAMARGMTLRLPHPKPSGGEVHLIGNPIHYSGTPLDPRRAPPRRGADTRTVLEEVLGLSASTLDHLQDAGILEDTGDDA